MALKKNWEMEALAQSIKVLKKINVLKLVLHKSDT